VHDIVAEIQTPLADLGNLVLAFEVDHVLEEVLEVEEVVLGPGSDHIFVKPQRNLSQRKWSFAMPLKIISFDRFSS